MAGLYAPGSYSSSYSGSTESLYTVSDIIKYCVDQKYTGFCVTINSDPPLAFEMDLTLGFKEHFSKNVPNRVVDSNGSNLFSEKIWWMFIFDGWISRCRAFTITDTQFVSTYLCLKNKDMYGNDLYHSDPESVQFCDVKDVTYTGSGIFTDPKIHFLLKDGTSKTFVVPNANVQRIVNIITIIMKLRTA